MRMRLKNGRVTDCEETYARRLMEQGAAEPADEAAAPEETKPEEAKPEEAEPERPEGAEAAEAEAAAPEEATEEAPQPPKKGGRKRGV